MQKIILMGFVGRNPEERFTSKGIKVTSFPVAVNTYKDKEKKTTWYKILCWDNHCAPMLALLKTGNCISIIGELQPPNTYQNKKGDIAVEMTVYANSISFLPSLKKEEEKKEAENPSVFEVDDL